MTKSKKIVFVHAGMRAYRNKLFNLLSKNLNLKYLFYVGKKQASKYKKEWEKDSKKWDYKIMFPIKNLGYTYITPQLFWEVNGYDTVVTSDLSSFATHLTFLRTRFSRKKFVVWGENWEWPEFFAARVIMPYVRLILRRCDSCIVAGSKAKEFFVENGANPDKVFIAPNCGEKIDKSNIDRKFQKNLKSKIGKRKVVLYLSRIVPYKGLDYLIKAFAKLNRKDLFLLIGGPGEPEYEKKCRELAKKLNIKNISFEGRIPHNKIANYYDLCDVFVLPSTFRKQDPVSSEAWGLVVNELLPFNKAIVSTTAVAAAFDLIENGKNGFRVKEKSVNELSKAISKALKLKKSTISKVNKEKMNEFTYEKQFLGFKVGIDYAIRNKTPLSSKLILALSKHIWSRFEKINLSLKYKCKVKDVKKGKGLYNKFILDGMLVKKNNFLTKWHLKKLCRVQNRTAPTFTERLSYIKKLMKDSYFMNNTCVLKIEDNMLFYNYLSNTKDVEEIKKSLSKKAKAKIYGNIKKFVYFLKKKGFFTTELYIHNILYDKGKLYFIDLEGINKYDAKKHDIKQSLERIKRELK